MRSHGDSGVQIVNVMLWRRMEGFRTWTLVNAVCRAGIDRTLVIRQAVKEGLKGKSRIWVVCMYVDCLGQGKRADCR